MKKILKYTQQGGFEEIDSPFEWPENGTFDEYLKAGGFGGTMHCEVADGTFAHNEGIEHWYNDNGSGFTKINDSTRFELIFTSNAADHMALRIALVPLAHLQLLEALSEIRAENGTLQKWLKSEQERDRRERLHRRAP